MIFQIVATFTCGVFFGAAVHINLVEQPARISCGTHLAVTQWRSSYNRGTMMHVPLALIGLLSAFIAWRFEGRTVWLVGGVLLLLVVPFTLVVIMPTNKRLESGELDPRSEEAGRLLRRWGRLHAIRSIFSGAAFLLFLSALAMKRYKAIRRVVRWQMQIDGNVLIGYTDWERQKWHDWLGQHREALRTSMGPHGDDQTVGEVVKHIFAVEKRYIERLSDQPLTDTALIPNDNLEALFGFGQQSRQALKDFIESFPTPNLDTLKDFEFVGWSLKATPKKINFHVLTHEIRHWAQIATVLRLNGFKGDFHDFIFSPVLGCEFRSG